MGNYLWILLLFPWNFGGDVFRCVDSGQQEIPWAAAVHIWVVFLLLISWKIIEKVEVNVVIIRSDSPHLLIRHVLFNS